ncbi:hypothetical protein ACJX0J_008169, partial [Zea mays]
MPSDGKAIIVNRQPFVTNAIRDVNVVSLTKDSMPLFFHIFMYKSLYHPLREGDDSGTELSFSFVLACASMDIFLWVELPNPLGIQNISISVGEVTIIINTYFIRLVTAVHHEMSPQPALYRQTDLAPAISG